MVQKGFMSVSVCVHLRYSHNVLLLQSLTHLLEDISAAAHLTQQLAVSDAHVVIG